MNRKTYHVTQKPDGGWQGKEPGASRAVAAGDTKAEVVQATKEIAKNQPLGQIVIHKSRDHGSVIQTEHTYGKDPSRYPG